MQNKLITIFITAFLGVLAWIWASTYSKLAEVEQGLANIQTQLAVVQNTMLTEDRVKELIEHELLRRGIK